MGDVCITFQRPSWEGRGAGHVLPLYKGFVVRGL